MEFKFAVISTFDIYDTETRTFTMKVHSDVFDSLDAALDSIKSFDYPPRKVTIHPLLH